MTPVPNSFSSQKGFTLTELLVVIAIIVTLTGIGFAYMGLVRPHAQKVTCISHLKILHNAFNSYVQEHKGVWPVLPRQATENEDDFWEPWIRVVAPYGAQEKHWFCPADKTPNDPELWGSEEEAPKYHVSYIPTDFDPLPYTCFKHATMPWLIERGANHGKTSFMAMPDGTVRELPVSIDF